jgi:hypothetical protein
MMDAIGELFHGGVLSHSSKSLPLFGAITRHFFIATFNTEPPALGSRAEPAIRHEAGFAGRRCA